MEHVMDRLFLSDEFSKLKISFDNFVNFNPRVVVPIRCRQKFRFQNNEIDD